MKSKSLLFCSLLTLLCACHRDVLPLPSPVKGETLPKAAVYVDYVIRKGEQFCDKNFYVQVDYREQRFSVIFDSSAVYESLHPANQADINKLYGFADNGMHHHVNSARIGWRWSEGALRLFAYVYNEGQIISREITEIAIGETILCSITISGKQYVFVVDGKTISLPRSATTLTGRGYKLSPYFGGDEVAPHEIHIQISEY